MFQSPNKTITDTFNLAIERPRARNFLVANTLLSFITLVFTFFYFFFVPHYELATICLLTFLGSLAGLIVFILTANENLGSHILLTSGFLNIFAGGFYNEGVRGPSAVWFIIATVAIGFILKPKHIKIWTAIMVCGWIAMFVVPKIFPQFKVTNIMDVESIRISIFLNVSLGIAVTGILTRTYVAARDESQQELLLEREKLTLALKELSEKEAVVIKQSEENETLVKILCHDIGNPLTVIKYALNRMELDPHNDLEKNMNRIKGATTAIQQITASVKQWQAMKSGKSTLALSSVNIVQALSESEEYFRDKLDAKEITIQKELPALEAPLHVIANQSVLIHNVLNNLVSNAIKFSPKKSIIELKIIQDQDFIRIHVRDHGVGMPSEIADKVFSPTSATTRPGTDGEQGTGFGLPIVKTVVEKFGGKISLSSKVKTHLDENSGTEFIVELKKAS